MTTTKYAIYQQTLGGMMMVPSFHIKKYHQDILGVDLPAYLPKNEIPKYSPSGSIFQLQQAGFKSIDEANAVIDDLKVNI